MSEWHLISSVCTARAGYLTYQSEDGLLGLQIISGGRKPDRRSYFVWSLPDSAPTYATEAEARAALGAPDDRAAGMDRCAEYC